MSDELSIPADWRPDMPKLESASDPGMIPLVLPEVGKRVPSDREMRERRIFATCRWAGVVAVTEMADGYDAAMQIVTEGPDRFLPDDEDWEKINETARVAINYIENGA